MNKTKILAITYVVLITLIIIFPPVQIVAGSRGTYGRGFSALWMMPSNLSINIPFLLIELFAVTAICAVIYFVFKKTPPIMRLKIKVRKQINRKQLRNNRRNTKIINW